MAKLLLLCGSIGESRSVNQPERGRNVEGASENCLRLTHRASGKTMHSSSQLRPRVSTKELEFIEYSLRVLELLARDKFEEIHNLRSDLKRFARIVWFTGDLKAFRLYEPYKKYVLAEFPKEMDMVKLVTDAQRLRRRVNGLLNGRRYHSRTLHSLGNGTKSS